MMSNKKFNQGMSKLYTYGGPLSLVDSLVVELLKGIALFGLSFLLSLATFTSTLCPSNRAPFDFSAAFLATS